LTDIQGKKELFMRTGKLSTQKDWAREHYKGMENLFMPSFSTDFKSLDEDGIRHDVRQCIRQGFFSMMLSGVGIRGVEENKQFTGIVCDEAKRKLLTGLIVSQGDLEGDLDIIKYAEEIGATHLFVHPAVSILGAKSEEDIYRIFLSRIEATQLPVVLYANFNSFNKIGVMLNVFDKLADLPNVVAIKLTQPMNLATAFYICERLSDRLLIGPVNLDFVPMLAKHYRVQWSGQWNVEAVQSPEKPYAVEFMKLLNKQCFNEAMAVYRQFEPALNAFFELQAPLLKKGGHPWTHMKYYQWCGGGNGGLLRDLHAPVEQVPVLDAAARKTIRDAFGKVGITPVTAPEEEFIVGKSAFSRGVRAIEMKEKPCYR
jgi:4-hydroxy-tetrahydrodipicolinate synthase